MQTDEQLLEWARQYDDIMSSSEECFYDESDDNKEEFYV